MHGISIGLAVDIATAADVRICARETLFAVKEVDIGLAADVGTLARLPRVVGNLSWVKDVCFSARSFDAAEALSVGFVSQVRADKAEAVSAGLEMAAFWASKSPVAVQGTKELLNHAVSHSVDESKYSSSWYHAAVADMRLQHTDLRYTSIWNSVMLQSDDFKRALMAGKQRTKPRFEKL